MQSTSKSICKKVAEDNDLDYDMVKSINDQLFQGLYKKSREGKFLNLKIPGFGIFRVRGKRSFKYEKLIEEYEYPESYKKFIRNILNLYEQFRQYRYDKKVAIFGQESHDAYLLAKKEKAVQQEVKPE